jgi:predicted NAD-dependent protein-ADP-ribosyltransferase YbiA (DUF1768 family)/uncharacterized HAD superfamily protein
MKKITLVAALLGAAYFSHAQVGIGTPTPADASQLDIVANNKGILIPRVELRTLSNFGPIAGTQIESLLVYNTASITAENIAPGFYYWFESKWERIVNQKQLDETINNITDLQGDVDKIINLLKVAFPSNNLVDPSVDGDAHGGGMVFTPGDVTTEPKIEYVYFDGTSYVKKDITSDIINIIRGAESKTTIVEYDGNQYYLSEAYIQNGGETDPANWTSVPSGAILLDVVAGVVNNFEEFVTNNSVTVDGNTYNTIEEYIEYISQNSMQDGVTKIVIDATTNQASFQIWDAATDTWVDVDNSAFKKIITDNESKTSIVEYDGNQYYLSEAYIQNGGETDPANWTSVPSGAILLDVVAGVVNNFEEFVTNNSVTVDGNTYNTIEEYIEYISQNSMQDGVTKIVIDATTNQASFQIWDAATDTWVDVDNSAFKKIITDNESKTSIVEYDGNQYYLSEAYIQNGGETDPANWTSVPSGAILLDVVAGVVNNFEEFVTNNSVTVDGNTYNTIEEYIEYISQNSMQDGVTKIVIDATTNQASFQIWDAATDTWVDVDNSAFKKIITDNESETTIVKNELGAIADGDLEITYDYFNEKQPDVTGTPQATIDVNADIKNLIEGNIDIQKAITKILNDGGNVYYGDHDNDGATPDVFYTIINDVKTPIDIAEVIVNAIKNATTVQKQEIKNQLGDKINNTTVTKTGDTFNGSDIYIYTNKTTIAANSAETTGIEIPSGTTPDQIIGIKVIGAKGVVASVTDIVVTGQQIDFNIGAGNMYNILGAGNYDVVVEFTAQ